MIFIYGRAEDSPITRVLEALDEAHAEYFFLDAAALDKARFQIRIDRHGVHGELKVEQRSLQLDDISAVYARPLLVAEHAEDVKLTQHKQALHQQLVDWFDIAPCLVVNRPAAMQANSSKPFQAQLISEAGFLVPTTLITSDPTEVRTFRQQHGNVIFKSISGVRSIVTVMDDTWLSRMHRLAQLPTQFQAQVPGVDVRVHVVGEETYAAEICSSATDYRYAHHVGNAAELRAIELPKAIAKRCVAMSKTMNLPLSGIDLRRRADGRYVCFEVNPMPAYSYFEAETGLPIAQALSKLLLTAQETDKEVKYGAGY